MSSSSGSRTSSSGTSNHSNIQFVQGNPRTKTERKQALTIVGLHASSRRWQKSRISRKANEQQNQDTSKRGFKTETGSIQDLLSSRSTSDNSSSSDGVSEYEKHSPWNRSPSEECLVYGWLNAPEELIAQDFGRIPKEVGRRSLRQMVDVLHEVFPAPYPGATSPGAANIMYLWASNKGVLFAFLYSQLVRNAMYQKEFSADEKLALVISENEAVKSIHAKFKDDADACDDENIYSVLSLAIHGRESRINTDHRGPCPNQGPLKNMTLLNIYSDIVTQPTHARGLRRMLELRGGIASLTRPGLAKRVSYADVMTASRNLTKPTYQHASTVDVEILMALRDRQDHPYCHLGQGFRMSSEDGVLSASNLYGLKLSIQHLRNYTLAMDDYVNRRPQAPDMEVLSEQRNFVQYLLLSLIPADDHQRDLEPFLSRLCRLSAIVYSLTCVFPISSTVCKFAELARDIRDAIEENSDWSEMSDLILWATTMGAVAATGYPAQAWFVSMLDGLTSKLGIRSWLDMRQALQEFLWYPPTNDVDGIKIWKEIAAQEHLRSQHSLMEPSSPDQSSRQFHSSMKSTSPTEALKYDL